MRDLDVVQAIFLPAALALTLNLSLTACTPTEDSHQRSVMSSHKAEPVSKEAQAKNKSTRHLYQMQANRAKSRAELEEYVSRIGKKVVIVSNNPQANIKFKVSDSGPDYKVNPNGTIQVSTRLLKNLNDEAELAAVLSRGIAKVNKQENQAELDMMTHAGFDPKAAVELEERSNDPEQPWLKNIYSRHPQTTDVNKLPKGLRRGADDYRKAVGTGS